MYKIAICDDRLEDGEKLRGLTRDYFTHAGFEYTISSFTGGESIVGELESGSRYDVYILDILMPGMNGMDLARTIRGKDDSCAIIFVTVSIDYAIEGYKVRALDYIVKPVTKDAFEEVLSRIVNRITQTGTIVIKIKNKTGYKEINTAEIVCVESQRHTIFFTMRDGSVEKVSAKLDEYAKTLTKYNCFLRCHKSFLVNLNYVKEMEQNRFLLKDGKIVNISNSNRDESKKRYYRFILDKAKGVSA